MNTILLGTLASLLAGLATAVGALPIFAIRQLSDRWQDTLLGFAAGVMLAASFFSLLIPSLEEARSQYGGDVIPASIAVVALLLGVGTIALLNHYAPHQHFIRGREGPEGVTLNKIWLLVIAMTIHNFPEGMAVGVSFGGDDITRGRTVATGIGLQNIPEGMAVAFALTHQGYRRRFAFMVAALTGLVEPLGGIIGVGLVSLSQPLLPWGLAFAAGAMLFVISHEIIPETHSRGHQDSATTGLMLGLVIMMFLDVTLG